MKTLFFVATLLIAVTNSQAVERWIRIDSGDTLESFVDLNSIRVLNGISSYKVLLNVRKPTLLVGSTILTSELKCSTKQARFISSTSFEQANGKGKIVGQMNASILGSDAGKFLPVTFGVEAQYRVVCEN